MIPLFDFHQEYSVHSGFMTLWPPSLPHPLGLVFSLGGSLSESNADILLVENGVYTLQESVTH
jgi:hypothetical protein